jgi:hypothetical protein
MVGLLGSWVEWLAEMEWGCTVVEALLVRLQVVVPVGTVPRVSMRWSWCGREREGRRKGDSQGSMEQWRS